MLEPGFNISFQLTEKQGAVLVTKYRTYKEDVQREQIFEEYTRRHHDSWVAFAREAGHGNDVNPVLVTGVDMTRDFAMMAYSSNSAGMESEFTTSVPMVASASISAWGTWRTEGLVHTNCGPQLCRPPSSTETEDLISFDDDGPENIPGEYNQCVFVRYFTVRKRALVFPMVIKAAAGPHDLGPGDRDDKELPEVGVESDSDSGSDTWDVDAENDRGAVTKAESESYVVSRNTISVRLCLHHAFLPILTRSDQPL